MFTYKYTIQQKNGYFYAKQVKYFCGIKVWGSVIGRPTWFGFAEEYSTEEDALTAIQDVKRQIKSSTKPKFVD